MRSGNPVLNSGAFSATLYRGAAIVVPISSVVLKTVVLFAILALSAAIATFLFYHPLHEKSTVVLFSISFAGEFTLPFIAMWKVRSCKVLAPIYAVCEGMFLGLLSSFADLHIQGTYVAVILVTSSIFTSMLLLYSFKIIKVTQRLARAISIAVFGILIVYLAGYVLQGLGATFGLPHTTGLFGFIFSLVVIVVASLCFLLDFEFIKEVGEKGLPSDVQWLAALGLIVTFSWLYIEIFRFFVAIIKDS